MHYFTLARVNVEKVDEDEEQNLETIKMLKELKKKVDADKNNIPLRICYEERAPLISNFARNVDSEVYHLMEPYYEQTDDPEYLEFYDQTQEFREDYNNKKLDCFKLSNGAITTYLSNFTIINGFVYERKTDSKTHKIIYKRSKKARKIKVLSDYPINKVFKTFSEYAEDYCNAVLDEQTGGYGYYSNPYSFWDWYRIGGRWSGMLLVKDNCKEYSLGEISYDETPDEAPEGYLWVSAARKKDIQWDKMQEIMISRHKDIFNKCKISFELKEPINDWRMRITESGVYYLGELIYKPNETIEENLVRFNLDKIESVPKLSPYYVLDQDGWSECKERLLTEDGEQKWIRTIDDFLVDTQDEDVIVCVDAHD